MPSIAARAQAIALKASRRLNGEAVVFTRGDTVVELQAVRGSTNWDTDAPFAGFRVGKRSVDWLIAVSDLVDNGEGLEPQRGDTITTGSGEVFRVIPIAPDSPLWQWVDRSGQTVRRIFTEERSS